MRPFDEQVEDLTAAAGGPPVVEVPMSTRAPIDGGAGDYEWPDPVDPFATTPAPHFPLFCLPQPLQRFAAAYAAQTGFDSGAYGFCLLVAAANSLDHRSSLAVANSFSVPPYLWGGLVDQSGGGKSPTINAATSAARMLNTELVRQSQAALDQWNALPPDERGKTERPPWLQRHALDTTIEAVGDLLAGNPEGVNIVADELTEFVGRMDAYNKGGGKDRSVYLRAFDGGPQTINRKGHHQHIENFSIGILAGIQPEKLVELYRRNGGGSDGLYQRFLFYSMAPAGEVDYSATISRFIDIDVQTLVRHLWRRRVNVGLSDEARTAANEYHNAMRTVAKRTTGARFAEHLSKFPGMVNRIALTLHCLEAAANEHPENAPVGIATWRRAQKIMACLYRHSEAVYTLLDEGAADGMALVRSAAEAILSQQWTRLTRSDLTRYATGWRGAETRTTEGAIDLLIEFGWLLDVTPVVPTRRGRRSDGTWLVNPAAHERFADHANRIKAARQERYEAVKSACAARSDSRN